MSLTLKDQVQIPDDILSSELGDETILLNLKTGLYHGLDSVGSTFFKILHANSDLASAHQAILQEYDVSPETSETDLLSFCEHMLAKGLLVVVA